MMTTTDIRATAVYREAEAVFRALRQPGTGQISDAEQPNVSPDGQRVVFSGVYLDTLEGMGATRICSTDLRNGDTRVLTFGPNTDHLPAYSPDGRQVAFLSDRHRAGDFQVYLLDAASGATRPAPHVEGWVEYLRWSPDGRRILLGVAGHGADVAAVLGAVTSQGAVDGALSWMPAVETGEESCRRRSIWVYELETDSVRCVPNQRENVWEAVWCGSASVAAVVSLGASEGDWYGAHLSLVDVATGSSRRIYSPQDQLGALAASMSGKHLCVVEALCSDRCQVAGELRLIDTDVGEVKTVAASGVDVTYAEWRSERHLLLAGHRGFETVVGVYDVVSGDFGETWASSEVTAGGTFAAVSGIGATGDCVLVAESFLRAPEIGVIRRSQYHTVRSFDLGYAQYIKAIASVEQIRWQARDGLEIQGWLLRPQGPGPFPLLMIIHGGPVWHWRPTWLNRRTHVLMLLQRGYAAFFPNPRGSTGRGQGFVRPILGDMGGADAEDLLAGLDHLVAVKRVDSRRIGVMGTSYGGFMTAWLVTRDERFGAAVVVAPVTNQVTGHLLSNIPQFDTLFLEDSYTNPGGKYFERSPIFRADQVKTPTLNICGALDRCAPAEEAIQFHNALLENGVKSVLVKYPQEGHGVRKLPALIDYTARVVDWFEEHLGVPRR